MTGNLNNAVEARIKKANQNWPQADRKIFRNKAINPKNQDIATDLHHQKHDAMRTERHRLILKTAQQDGHLHVQAPTHDDEPSMAAWRMVSGANQLYTTLHQSTMESWLNKTKVISMLTQTPEPKTTPNRTYSDDNAEAQTQENGSNNNQST